MAETAVEAIGRPRADAAEGRSEWIQQIRDGDEAAFAHLFQTYAPALCAVLVRYTGSPAAAEDIVQDLFLTLWRTRATVAIEGGVSAYLLRAARNRALNHLRSAKVRERFLLTHLEQESAGADEAELLSLLDLNDAISRLPPRCRLVFTLSRQQGFTYQEIAADLGVSIKTVDTQIQRALRSVRAWLRPNG